MRKLSRFLLAGVLMISVTACSSKEETKTTTSSGSQEQTTETVLAATTNIDYTFDDEDFDDSYDETATRITLTDTSAQVDGTGVKVSGSTITIHTAGTYVVSGTLQNGQLVVDATNKDIIRIVLKDATITSNTSSAIYVKQADKTILILADGSENTITDAKSYTYDDNVNEEPNAAIFSKDDLTITGNGSLYVNGNFNHGIFSKDDLVITNGTYQINSANDGLKGKDGIAIAAGTFTIAAQGDGLQASEAQDAAKGWIYIKSGTFTINANGDGIQAETYLEIEDGAFTITTGGGSVNASTSSSWGNWGPQGTISQSEDTTSAKGIKSGNDMILSNGVFTLDTSDDALHGNASMTIKQGTYTITSGDDGIHTDATLTIDQGSIDIQKSYEGIEGNNVIVNDGSISVVSSDDGFNSAGGNDSSSSGRPGQNSFQTASNATLEFHGGTIYVRASGDGLDSNGTLTITGGVIIVDGPTDSGNGALDYDGSCTIDGGTLIAAGMSGMAQMPSSSSSQASVMITFSSMQSAGTLISILDGNDALLSYAPDISFNCIVISTPSMIQGSTYTLASGGTVSGDVTGNAYLNGFVSDASALCEFSLSSTVLSISDRGTSVSSGMQGGGRGGHGGF